jgi:cyclophilin family peptidyl-prolyl cis-trans isomerase
MRAGILLTSIAVWSTVGRAQSGSSSNAASAADSALVARILTAEDRRDSTNQIFAEASRHPKVQIRDLARRALERVHDVRFTARDSFPKLPAPPVYQDPAWRVRYRALTAQRENCDALRAAMADTSVHVQLRATDLIGVSCATDSALVRELLQRARGLTASTAHARTAGSWHAHAHALVALARVTPAEARILLPRYVSSRVPWVRTYAARAAAILSDTALLKRLARDGNDNVKEVALDSLSRVAGHAGDGEFITALSARGYQAVRAGARALKGSPRGTEVLAAALVALQRLRADSSETSRDARLAVLERVAEFATRESLRELAVLAPDFDCAVARATIAIISRLSETPVAPRCASLPISLPADAVALALGRDVRLRVTMADSSGGGSFVVRLRGDVAPIMAARVLELARSGYYSDRAWYRVEPDFVLQGGGPGANEYVGHPRFMRDELGTVPHVRGTVGMSTRGHDTGDAQWFVNLRDNLRLGRDYTVFAEVVEGIEVVDSILEGDVIARIEIVGT